MHFPQTLAAILTVLVAVVGCHRGAESSGDRCSTVGHRTGARAGFLLVIVVTGAWNRRSIKSSPPSLEPRLPSARRYISG